MGPRTLACLGGMSRKHRLDIKLLQKKIYLLQKRSTLNSAIIVFVMAVKATLIAANGEWIKDYPY